MSKTPFADLHQLEEKSILPKVTGKITALKKPMSKTRDDGEEYTMQFGDILVDGIKLGLTLFDQNLEPEYEGKTVTIKSVNKKGLRGIEYGVYKDKEKLTISSQALIDIVGAAPSSTTNTRQETTTELFQEQSRTQEDVINNIVEIHHKIDHLVRMAYEGKVKDEETLRCYVSSCFIETCKNGITHLNASKPTTTLKQEPKDELPEEGTDHGWKDWASMKVPSGKYAGEQLVIIPKVQIKDWAEKLKDKKELTDFQKAVMQAARDMNLLDEKEEEMPE